MATLSAVRRKLVVVESTPEHQKAPKITDLPYELIFVIIGSLDKRSIACMVQTCQDFRSLLEPILYRHIQVFRSHTEATSNPLKSFLLHRTLVERPDILSFVLSYHGPLVPDIQALQSVILDEPMMRNSLWFGGRGIQQPSRKVPVFDESLEVSKTIFRGTVNIQDLHFTDQISDSTIGILDSLKNIEKLALNIGGYSSLLLPALRTQPRLKHLELLRGGSEDLFQSTDLPELRSLKATLLEAAEIVPGRPVERLELLDYWAYKDYDQGRTEDLFRDLTRSACDITDFTTRISRPLNHKAIKNSLRLVAQYLPRIERLCISFRQGVSDSRVSPTLRGVIPSPLDSFDIPN